MQKIIFKYPSTEIQRIFVEKGFELLYKGTIDSYRIRLHNPKTLLEELVSVCQAVKDGALRNIEYVTEVSNELREILKEDTDGLTFHSVNRDYFKGVLGNSKNKGKYGRIIQASKLLLRDNQNYLASLFDSVWQMIEEFDETKPIPNRFLLLSHYLFIDVVNMGYTKQYLYHYFRSVFVYSRDENYGFRNRFEEWKSISTRGKNQYKIIYNVLSDPFQYREMLEINNNYKIVNKRFRATLPVGTSSRFKKYLEENKHNKLLAIEVSAYDHFKAVEISRAKLSSDLDLYHLGFNSQIHKIDLQAGVINESNPAMASTVPSNYQIDGYIRSSRDVFETLLEKVRRMKGNNVAQESINKVISAIRYLRSGSELPELEAKLLNYWIGLEYIFTSFQDEEKTIDRIRANFPVCHALIYVKRNLYDFHKAIGRVGLADQISEYAEDLLYLSNFSTYEILKQQSDSALLATRAIFFQEWASDPSKITKSLHKHQNNLTWNISRLYRMRNEIVHNAAIKDNIFVNVSHIKYYLTFILNSILEFMSEIPVDVNNDGQITIEDYFITQDIMLGALKGKTIKDFIKVNNPLELLN